MVEKLRKSNRRRAAPPKAAEPVYCICKQEYDDSRFMIECDVCKDWFHGSCVGVKQSQANSIDKYHCPDCAVLSGPLHLKKKRKQRRHDYSRMDDGDIMPVENIPFVERLAHRNFESASARLLYLRPEEFSREYFASGGFTAPIFFTNSLGLGLRTPPDTFTIRDVERCVGSMHEVSVIDVQMQEDFPMVMREWSEYFEGSNGTSGRKEADSIDRDRVLNVISLEFSKTRLGTMVDPPTAIQSISWVENLWPHYDELMRQFFAKHSSEQNGDADAKSKKRGRKGGQKPKGEEPVDEPSDESRDSSSSHAESAPPTVQKYCLMSVKDAYTDFHIDFGGSSVWYHMLWGHKVFYFIEPTAVNLAAFELWSNSTSQSTVFFGDQVETPVYAQEIHGGETMLIPSGWIHAVLTLEDSLVFGGNFIHSYSIPMQLKIYDMEKRINTPAKYQMPQYETVCWFAAERLDAQFAEFLEERKCPPHYLSVGLRALHNAMNTWTLPSNVASREHRLNVPSSIEWKVLLRSIQRHINQCDRLFPLQLKKVDAELAVLSADATAPKKLARNHASPKNKGASNVFAVAKRLSKEAAQKSALKRRAENTRIPGVSVGRPKSKNQRVSKDSGGRRGRKRKQTMEENSYKDLLDDVEAIGREPSGDESESLKGPSVSTGDEADDVHESAGFYRNTTEPIHEQLSPHHDEVVDERATIEQASDLLRANIHRKRITAAGIAGFGMQTTAFGSHLAHQARRRDIHGPSGTQLYSGDAIAPKVDLQTAFPSVSHGGSTSPLRSPPAHRHPFELEPHVPHIRATAAFRAVDPMGHIQQQHLTKRPHKMYSRQPVVRLPPAMNTSFAQTTDASSLLNPVLGNMVAPVVVTSGAGDARSEDRGGAASVRSDPNTLQAGSNIVRIRPVQSQADDALKVAPVNRAVAGPNAAAQVIRIRPPGSEQQHHPAVVRLPPANQIATTHHAGKFVVQKGAPPPGMNIRVIGKPSTTTTLIRSPLQSPSARVVADSGGNFVALARRKDGVDDLGDLASTASVAAPFKISAGSQPGAGLLRTPEKVLLNQPDDTSDSKPGGGDAQEDELVLGSEARTVADVGATTVESPSHGEFEDFSKFRAAFNEDFVYPDDEGGEEPGTEEVDSKDEDWKTAAAVGVARRGGRGRPSSANPSKRNPTQPALSPGSTSQSNRGRKVATGLRARLQKEYSLKK